MGYYLSTVLILSGVEDKRLANTISPPIGRNSMKFDENPHIIHKGRPPQKFQPAPATCHPPSNRQTHTKDRRSPIIYLYLSRAAVYARPTCRPSDGDSLPVWHRKLTWRPSFPALSEEERESFASSASSSDGTRLSRKRRIRCWGTPCHSSIRRCFNRQFFYILGPTYIA